MLLETKALIQFFAPLHLWAADLEVAVAQGVLFLAAMVGLVEAQ